MLNFISRNVKVFSYRHSEYFSFSPYFIVLFCLYYSAHVLCLPPLNISGVGPLNFSYRRFQRVNFEFTDHEIGDMKRKSSVVNYFCVMANKLAIAFENFVFLPSNYKLYK